MTRFHAGLMTSLVILLSFFLSSLSLQAENPTADPVAGEIPVERKRTHEQAQREAALLHDAMHATLQLVHHRYYKENEGLIIPASTLDEIFDDLEKEHQVQLRWLVVEGQAMNQDNIAVSEFEKNAVKSLQSGEKQVETIEQGMYRRAGPITLSNVCLKCHIPDRKSTANRTAGLIVSIPVLDDATK